MLTLSASTRNRQISGEILGRLHLTEGNPAFISASVNGDIREKFAYLRNMQGDIIGLVNESGAVVVRYYYDAWGKLLQTEVSDSAYNDIAEKNPLRYRGYVYDTETGMYYVESRYYNPDICRFISSDNVYSGICATNGLAECNLFAYCDNNPVLKADDGGDFWNCCCWSSYWGGC